jgi:hypothetical protein
MRVHAGSTNDPGTYRVANNVAGNAHHILFLAQGMVMKSALPDWATCRMGYNRLDTAHHPTEWRCGCQGQEPMQMVRHDHKSQGARPTHEFFLSQGYGELASQTEIKKAGLAMGGAGRH